jgi:hypothetical protein
MIEPDLYLELSCGIKIPVIQVIDSEGCELNIAPVATLKLLQNSRGNIYVEEAKEIDENIFFYADKFERSELMLMEITTATDIEVHFA